MQVFIHIGTNKTGTTAFQTYARQHRRALLNAGVLYPKTGLGTVDTAPEHHYELAQALIQKSAQLPKLCSDLAAEIANSSADKAIISSEFLIDAGKPELLGEHLAAFDCKVLVYLRRHDFWVDSMFNQAIKTERQPNWAPDIEDFIRYKRRYHAHWFSFSRLLGTWSGIFGKENVIVRPYHSDRRMDILSEILGVLDVDPSVLPPPAKQTARINSSLSRRQLAAIDFVQRSEFNSEIVERVIRQIVRSDDAEGPTSLISPSVARRLIEENAADYQMIAREYLGHEDGVLFEEPLPEVEDGAEQSSGLSPYEGLHILTKLLAERSFTAAA